MDINYELYKVFYCVAVTLSFSEASRRLFISQSAVSQSIKVLEKKLNQKLFVRSTKKVQLTPDGETLFRYIEPAMNLIRQGERCLVENRQPGGGTASHRSQRHDLPLLPGPLSEPVSQAVSPHPHQGCQSDFHPLCRASGAGAGGYHCHQLP